MIIALLISLVFSIALFNGFGCSVTKFASAASRATIDVARTGLIWMFFLLVPLNGKKIETFKWLQLIGFLVIISGSLLYNEIIVLPFWGFNEHLINNPKKAKESFVYEKIQDETS